MANPILERLGQNSSPMQSTQETTGTKISDIYRMVRNSGKSPKDLFYSMCAAKGVDPNVIINQVRSQV